MKLLRAAVAVTFLVLGGYALHAASTINPNVPIANSPLSSAVVRNNFTSAYNDVNNLLGKFAGTTAPLVPTPMQDWVNTSSSLYSFNFYNPNTASWVPWGTLNTATGVFSTGADPSDIVIAHSVDFDTANADTIIPVVLPPGYTRYLVTSVRISHATHSLTTATAGVFTSPGAAGIAVVSGGTAITVSATADATNNNAMAFTINNGATISYTVSGIPNLYLRVGAAEGAAATGTVTIGIAPLP